MKVLQFVTRMDLGGAQEVGLDLCRELLEQKHEVHLLTGTGGGLMDEARGMEGLVVHAWPDWVHPIRPLADLRCATRLIRFLRQERFDLLCTHTSKSGLVGRLAAKAAGTPARVVHHVHGWSFNESQPAMKRALFVAAERIAARPGYLMLACCKATGEQGRRRKIGRDADRRVVVNGVPPEELPGPEDRLEIRRRLGLAESDLLVLQLANLKPQKDPITFAEAAVRAGREIPEARFWIAGDGPLREQAERIARDGGLGDRFRILGWRRDVDDLLSAANILTLTSRFEGLPMAILRGMAVGLPIVATAVDGNTEAVVDGETGFLVPPGDPAAAGRALVRLAGEPALRERFAVAARRRSAMFTAERAIRETLGIYLEGGNGYHGQDGT
jgi:glycosyltransferase involved in cell wall biosynthesis